MTAQEGLLIHILRIAGVDERGGKGVIRNCMQGQYYNTRRKCKKL